MNGTLVKASVGLIPVTILLAWSVDLFFKRRTLGSALQLLGTACLLVVGLTHVAEALHLFLFMNWGNERSAGHYLDLSSAILGVTLSPLGFLLRVRANRRQGRVFNSQDSQ